MIKKYIVGLSLLFSVVSFAQIGTASPYSYYGIGDVRFKGLIENKSMAGISSIPDSLHINVQNPAMYSSLKMTSFAVGATTSSTNLQTSTESEKVHRTTLDYVAIAIPIYKLGIGFGLLPYSYVGYNIKSIAGDTGGQQSSSLYQGTGGINKAYVGFGYQITKNFSFGADAQYNFGRIKTTDVAFQLDSSGNTVQYGTLENNISDAGGFNFNVGVSFKSQLKKELSIFSSATYSPEANLHFDNLRQLGTVQPSSVVVGDLNSIEVANTTVKLPSKLTFGLGVGDPKKWIISSEVVYQNFSNFSNRYNEPSNGTYENSTRIAVGGYYIPKYNSFGKYYQRIVYRGGFRYENTGLIVSGTPIDDKALTMGFGLPLKGTVSNVNIGLEYGSKGTKDAGLVKENYFNLSVGLSFTDQWFQRRKIY